MNIKIASYDLDVGKCLFLLLIVPGGALLGIILRSKGIIQCTWKSDLLALALFVPSCLAITAGYHLLFSHPTYKATLPLRIFHLLFGAAAFQGPVLDWAEKHREHHSYVDTARDPYRIWDGWRGFVHAHIGWMLIKQPPLDFKLVPDLIRDPLILWQRRLDVPLAVTMTFILPTLLGMLWGEASGALFMAGFLRLVIQWHMTFSVNSVAHRWGTKKYSKSTARGTGFLIALVTFGAGQDHDRHHATGVKDYRTGIRWWDFDPAKWFIWTCSKIGLTSNLRLVSLPLDQLS